MDPEAIVLLTVTLAFVAGVAILWIAMLNRRHIRELEHRERLAMIERGLLPAPEVDPAAFEMRSGLAPASRTASRTRSAGVMLIGLGLALILLIGLAGGGIELGIGIGGAFAMVGAAFLVNALLSSRGQTSYASRDPYRRLPTSAPRPPDAPPSSNVPQ